MLKSLNYKKENILVFFFIIGILASIISAAYNVKKFDKLGNNGHLMIRGDTLFVWKEAEVFKKDISENKNLFGNGIHYTRTFLPSKFIAFYSFVLNTELFENYSNIYDDIKVKIGDKFFFFIISDYFVLLKLIFFI